MLLLLALTVPASGAEPITVRAVVETDRVFAGESFAYRVTVEGATPQVEPQLPALDAFEVAYEGGQDVSSHSISIVNGRRTETIIEQYYFQYRLTALSPGQTHHSRSDVDDRWPDVPDAAGCHHRCPADRAPRLQAQTGVGKGAGIRR